MGARRDKATAFIVDDDPAVCDALRWLIGSIGLAVETFTSADDFMKGYDCTKPGCLVLDVRMPGMSGLALQETLTAAGMRLPVIVISGHGDVPIAVRAMKLGAVDFIEKPFSDDLLLDSIQQAVARDAQDRAARAFRNEIAARLESLTEREREVLDLVISGHGSKQIAAQLDLSVKTVEVHRSHLMEKMQATSVADLVREALVVLPNPSVRHLPVPDSADNPRLVK